jgi:A/G-specific adenine glycosylase
MKTFPSIESLAAANEKEVLKLWEGLGYYSRARNLHQSARLIVEKFGGKFPEDFETIRSIKGIGRYTAGAVASIAFNQERPIVDGNVLRVLSRVYAINESTDDLKVKESFWNLQEKLIPKGEARFFNQALMELGALVCLPANPSCLACPIKKHCRAFQKNLQDKYPPAKKKLDIIQKKFELFLILKSGKNSKLGQFLISQRGPEERWMKDMWEFPMVETTAENSGLARLSRKLGAKLKVVRPLGSFTHTITRHRALHRPI